MATVLVLSAFALTAQQIPLRNWTVPPYVHSEVGLTTMTDVSPGVGFTAMAPCRVVDTRNPDAPYGGPALASNVSRTFDVDNGPCTGIPAGVKAYSLSIGAILSPADGFLTAWPAGSALPVVSQLNMIAGKVVANAAIVPAGSNGAINVLVNVGPTNIYIDINGYFTDDQNPSQSLIARSSNGVPAIIGENTSTVANAQAIRGAVTQSGTSPSVAVRGINNGSSDLAMGMYGSADNGTGIGVYGTSLNGVGVEGDVFNGVAYSVGVIGYAGGTGIRYGVQGYTTSTASNAVGVIGQAGFSLLFDAGAWLRAGVRGQGSALGVLGITNSTTAGEAGSEGFKVNAATGAITTGSYLGYSTTVGLHTVGDTSATGTKGFVEPHPTDPSRMIRYVSLEGPEAGTYFRGRGRFQRGLASIRVPEDFRFVTEPEGLTVQITPVGDMASFAVVRLGLDEIFVKASRDVEFFYLVQGVRRGFSDVEPIQPNEEFRPLSPDSRMPDGYAAGQKRRLIENGTYSVDGKVNLETARRLGWDRAWEEEGGRAATQTDPAAIAPGRARPRPE
jgi:hypothetical protein